MDFVYITNFVLDYSKYKNCMLLRKDNWDVEWKINDETIAKCIPEKGIENNIHGITQIAGKASINALKAGSTKLSVKVKVSNNKTEEIEIPITIVDSDEKKDDEEISNGAKIKILAENDKKVLDIGETLKLSVEFLEMSDQNVNWESIDSSIATVDKAGKVTALKEGTVKIKVYTEDKNYYDPRLVDFDADDYYLCSSASTVSGNNIINGDDNSCSTMLKVDSLNSKGQVSVSNKSREIGQNDINRVIECASNIAIPLDRQVLHVVPQMYTVENSVDIVEKTKDPTNMLGSRLYVDVHIITATTTTMQNIITCASRSGYTVDGIMLKTLATAQSVLTEEEKELAESNGKITVINCKVIIFISNTFYT